MNVTETSMADHDKGEQTLKAKKERLYLFDTTLRDGAQTQGVDFSLDDKLLLAEALDELGIDYVEGGYPGANPTDSEFFEKRHIETKARLTAFGMTRRVGRSLSNDSGFQALLAAEADAICLVAKSWDYHVRVALGVTNDENLQTIGESVKAVVASGREAMVDCEHFFDGFASNKDYALSCAKAAYEAGARWVVLCDTNGGTLPHEVYEIVSEVAKHVPGTCLGIHAHNDTGNAVANSLMAIRAGVRQVQGTINGLGERCGNANLTSIIPTLLLKSDFANAFETGVTPLGLQSMTHLSRLLDEVLNRAPLPSLPYVGASAFAHKGGIHVSAVQKDPQTYEHVAPEAVGNERKLLVSNQAGKSNILAELKRLNIDLPLNEDKVDELLFEVKRRSSIGYTYEGADASFELLARRILGSVPRYFVVDRFRVMVERRYNAAGELTTVSEATTKVTVDGETMAHVGEGNGPIHALDRALRKDLGRYQAFISDLELVDYKVRILTGGTDAVTRVLVESRDGQGGRWYTIGVSTNIVDASFEALVDSINYKLMRDGAEGPKIS
jgi:2-isopropylmalate synthase